MSKFVDNKARKEPAPKPKATHVVSKATTEELRAEIERRQKEQKK